MKRRIVVALVFILAIGLCAGLVWFNFFRDKMITQFFANMQPPAQTISAAKVEAKTWTPSISAIGTARAANGVELAFETPGIVKEIKFKANQTIQKGDVLVQLDDTVERSDIQDVQANVKTAESAFERAKTLSTRGYGTEANLDQASALLAAARSRLARLEATIEQKALKAPFSGVIGRCLTNKLPNSFDQMDNRQRFGDLFGQKGDQFMPLSLLGAAKFLQFIVTLQSFPAGKLVICRQRQQPINRRRPRLRLAGAQHALQPED